jgi:maltose-binding protein MalE
MKKILKKGVIVCLAVALTLMTGCNNGAEKNNKKTAMGRYIEQDIGYPNGVEFGYLFQKENETIQCYTYIESEDRWAFYNLNSEGKWEEDVNAVKILHEDDAQNIVQMAEIGGKINILYTTANKEVVVGEVQDNGEIDKVTLKENNKLLTYQDQSSPYFKKSENGDILFKSDWRATVKSYDGKTGAFKYEFDGNSTSFETIGDKLYETTYYEEINIYNLESGDLIDKIENIDTHNSLLVKGKEEGELYIAHKNGIEHLAANGDLWEQVVPPNRTAFNEVNLMPYYLFIDHDSYVVFFMGPKTDLKRYYYSKEVPTSSENEINVYMVGDNDLVRQAISLYEKEHDDVSITIQIGTQSMSYADAVKSLNTDLLAGGGPDLIMLDALPIDTYIDKGVLLDLSDLTKEPLEKGEWYENIVDSFEKNGKYYALPMRFVVPMLWGKEEIVNNVTTIEDLAKYKETHPGEVIFSKTKPELFAQFETSCATSWFNEDGSLNKENLRSFLESIDTLATEDYSEEKRNEYCFRNDIEPEKYGELLDIAYNVSNVTVGETRSPMEALQLTSVIKQRGAGSVGCLKQTGEISFRTNGILGVNASSKNQEAAKEIIKIALGEEVQSLLSWAGNPINKKAMMNQQEQSKTFNSNEISDDQGRRVTSDKTIDELYTKVDNYSSSATVYAPTYRNDLYETICNECRAYYNGKKTLEEALDEIDKVAELQAAE